MKITLSTIKNNPQETNREEKETGIQTNDLEYKEEIKYSTRTKRRNTNSRKRG